MATKQEVTAKNFGTKLSGATRSIKTASANLQELLSFAGADYLATGDSGYLKKLVNACVGVTGLATGKMIGYIVESSDLKCVSVENKKGLKERVFKREKAGKDVPRKFELPNYSWNNWVTPEQVAKEFVVDDKVANLIKAITKELPHMKGAKLQHALKTLVTLKNIIGDDSVTEVPAKKAA